MPDEGGRYYCPQCGYDLRGQAVDRCPECGFEYDKPALESLAAARFAACLDAYLDALPLLSCMAVIILAAVIVGWAAAGPKRGGAVRLALEFIVLAPALALYVAAWLRVWILWPVTAICTRSNSAGLLREACSRLVLPFNAGESGTGMLGLVLLVFGCLWSLGPWPVGVWIVGLGLLIAGWWSAVAAVRTRDLKDTNRFGCLSPGHATALGRAAALCWGLLSLDFLGWCLVLLPTRD